MSCFRGFLPAIEACALDWKNSDLGIAPEEKVLQVPQPLTLPCAIISPSKTGKDMESGSDKTTTTIEASFEEKRLDYLCLLLNNKYNHRCH